MSERQSADLTIRLARPKDAAALLAIYAPYVEETAITFEYQVPSEAEFRGRIENTLARYPYLAAEQAGRVIGYAYAGPFHPRAAYGWAAEVSVYVDRFLRRQGAGRVLYRALEQLLTRQNILNLNACIAWPEGEDPYLTRDSAAFHARMGYKEAGHFHQCGYKFGRWYDMIWMEKIIGCHRENPPAVRNFSELLTGNERNDLLCMER